MTTISFARHQFPPAIIRHAVWLYARFALSYRDVEELLAERGLDISYETIRRWVLKFGPLFLLESFAAVAPARPLNGISTRWL
jgi:putative transposase